MNYSPMPRDKFWLIVEQTRKGGRKAQTRKLRNLLASLQRRNIVGFELAFKREMWRSNRFDVWAAADLAMGFCSDDNFEYFRRWLISRGRQAFEAVLREPDSLIDFLPCDCSIRITFEEFDSIPGAAWYDKTGDFWNDVDASRFPFGHCAELSGSWPKGLAHWEAFYPRLCRWRQGRSRRAHRANELSWAGDAIEQAVVLVEATGSQRQPH